MNKSRLGSWLVVGLAACLTTLGSPWHSAAAGEAPPQPGPPRPFQLPTPQTVELDNGMRTTFVAFGAVPKTTIVAVVRTGHLNQGANTWLSDMVGDMLEEGSTRRTAEDISNAVARMGGGLGISVADEETTISLDVLSEAAPAAIELIAEVLREPLLPASELPRIKQNYLRNLSVIRTQAQAQASAVFAELLYAPHPYGKTLPTEAQINGYTIEDIRQYYSTNFGAARTHVYIAGQFNRALLDGAISRAFAGWARGPDALMEPPQPARKLQGRLIDRPGAPQSTIRIGIPVIGPEHPDFMAMSLTNTVLGGSITSRITTNLREDKGWAYSPNSSVAARFRDAVWVESADVTTSATGPALAEVFKEITRLQNEPPSVAELTSMKSYRNGLFVLGNATRGGVIGQLAFMNLHRLPADWLTTFLDRLYAVTPEQISQAAREQLKLNEATVVVVGDAGTVRSQLQTVPELEGLTFE